MKKIILLLLTAFPFSLYAQLKVYQSGNVTVNQITENPYSFLSVDNSGTSFTSAYNIAVNCGTQFKPSSYNIGLQTGSLSNTAQSSGRTYGVFATVGNGMNGYNYALFGRLCGSQNGAGVVGTVTDNMGFNIPGKYAGYFDGDIYVVGNVFPSSVLTLSDIRLKQNVTVLGNASDSQDETLDNIMGLNVIKYNLLERNNEDSDTAQVAVRQTLDDKTLHYGVSPQELQKIYPDLVKEGQDGYLGINYIEMVPILLRSIQQLKQKVDELGGSEASMSRTSTALSSALTSGNMLYQNSPNPFKELTRIRFSLAENSKNANICIFDMNGKMLKKLPVSEDMNCVTIGAYELGEGMYLYSLVVNGREIDTKRMIVTK